MLPRSIQNQLDKETPKINPDIANGLAVKHLKHVEAYVNDIMYSAARDFPKEIKYIGCRRCTPIEEFRETTKVKSNRSVFDVSTSNVYMMEYKFSFNGQELPPIYMYLPYVTRAGTIHLGGSRFIVSPVLADKVVSIGTNSVFVRLLKAKLNFNRVPYYYNANNERESIQVAWSKIYNKKVTTGASNKPSVKANCSLVHYLFCKYGFTETFKRFLNIEPVVGYDEINENNYNTEEWVICSSTRMKPKGYVRKDWQPTNIRIAIRKEEYTHTVKNYIAGFFYIADHFPHRIKLEYLDNTRLWMTLLGLLIWNDNVSEGKLHSDINDHILSLDEYIDLLIRDKLKEIGHDIEDIYQLFNLVINKFDEWLLTSNDRVNTMYDKELSILYNVCYDIIEAVFNLYFSLKAAARKKLEPEKITKEMRRFLKQGIIFRMTREHHGEVSTTSTSGDNMFFRLTNILVPQTNSNKVTKGRSSKSISDPSKLLHASIIEVGAVAALPKSAPDGRSRISPYLKISETGQVLRNEEHRALIDSVQEKIRR